MSNVIKEAKEKAFRTIEKEIKKSKISSDKKDNKAEEIKSLLFSKEMVSSYPKEQDVMESSTVNKESERLRLDLMTAMNATDLVSKFLSGVSGNHGSFIKSIHTDIDILSDEIDSLEQSFRAKLNPIFYIDAFRSSSSFERNPLFYTERFGETVGELMKISYNKAEQTISLPETVTLDALNGNDVVNAKVSIEKQTGGSFMKIKTTGADLKNVLDSSDESFWSETILSNEKIKEVSLSDGYQTFNGAMCELKIELESVRRINQITLNPYGQFPVSLISILYTETDNPNEEKKEFTAGYLIPKFSNEAESNTPMFLEKRTSFRFKDTTVKNIFVLFVQTHYTKESLVLSKDALLKTEIWDKARATSEKKVYEKQMIFLPLLEEDSSSLPKAIGEKVNNLSIKDKSDIYSEALFEDDRSIAIEKYAYSYGFYEIRAEYKDYSNTGIYVSAPISGEGSIKEIQIESEEYHPKSEDEKQPIKSDVEYYIAHSEAPEEEDWLPIFPVNKSLVECELLQIANDSCPLRFPAETIMGIYLNSRKLEEGLDYTLRVTNGKIKEVYIPNYNFNGIYTAKYIPSEESKKIFYGKDHPAEQGRYIFTGKNVTSNKLPHYVNSRYSTDLTVTDTNTGVQIRQDRKELHCVTNVNNPSESYQNFTKNSNMLQYYIDRDTIYFNKSIGPEMTLTLDYKHEVSSARLKIIIRRNSYERWSTPVVSRVGYRFVTE